MSLVHKRFAGDREFGPKHRVKYKFTAEYLRSVLGLPGELYNMAWDCEHEVLTIYCNTTFHVAEAQAMPTGDGTELTPYDLTVQEVREAIQEYKEKKNEREVSED